MNNHGKGYFIIPYLQGGPLAVISRVVIITPLTEVITPVTHLFSTQFYGPHNSIYNNRRGPPCSNKHAKQAPGARCLLKAQPKAFAVSYMIFQFKAVTATLQRQ